MSNLDFFIRGAIAGIVFSSILGMFIFSLFETRRKHYDEFISRRYGTFHDAQDRENKE